MLHVFIRQRGQWNDFRERERLRIGGNQGKQRFALRREVNFIHAENHRRVDVLQHINNVAIPWPNRFFRLSQVQHRVNAFDGFDRRVNHQFVQAVLRLMKTGRVEKNNLRLLAVINPHDFIARRLRLL